MTAKQTAPKIRSLLRSAGPMVRVKQSWIANYLKITASEVSDALDVIETPAFRIIRVSGSGASVAMA